MYQYVDAALIRAAAYPDGWRVPPPPAPAREAGADARLWRRWIERTAADRYLRDAIELASPSLAQAIRAVCSGRLIAPKRVRRTGLALLRYALRLRHRATPFGMFAGVASARLGTRTEARWGGDHCLVLRPDAAWLSAVVDALEDCPELLRRLSVVADATRIGRGDRLVIPCRRAVGDSGSTPGEVNVRLTPPVGAILAHASEPTLVADLVDRVTAEFTDVSSPRLEQVIAGLVRHGFLHTSLRPAMTVSDGLGHALDVLDAAGADEIVCVAPTVWALRDIETCLQPHVPVTQRPGSPGALSARRDVAVAMTSLSEVTEQPLAADLRLDCTVRLPEAVGREAASAADALARLSPRPLGGRSWRAYHARFIDRYGPNALVPVTELVDPDLGLGYPAGYRSSPHPPPSRHVTGRDEHLLALAHQAAVARTPEITLTGPQIDELAEAEPTAELPHLDLCVRIHATSTRAVDTGDFTLVVTGVTPTGGATAGRFLHLLDADDRDRMIASYVDLPTLTEGARLAQISSPPLRARTENVARAPAVLPDVISVGEHHPGGIQLADLAVTADTKRFYVVSRETGTPVEPSMMNAVDLPSFTHPLARFLCELPRSHAAAVVPFHWGTATNLPYLPRIRYGRAVLSLATWRIRITDLPAPQEAPETWTAALRTWRRRFRVPATVDLGDDDQRLRLNLRRGADRAILRGELHRAGHVTLREAADEATAYGWLDGRPHELTLPLASSQAPGPALHFDGAAVIDSRSHSRMPGVSRWAQARLTSHHVPELIRRLPALLDHWDDAPPVWWFVRGHDHLRLSFRLPRPDAHGRLTAYVGSWCTDLRRSGLLSDLCWETSYTESAGEVAVAMENAYAADSSVVLAQLALARTGTPHPMALTAAGLVDLAISFLGDTRAAMHWLVDHAVAGPATPSDRSIRDDALQLARPHNNHQALRRRPRGERVVTAWATRRDALDAYRSRLIADGRCLESALAALIDVHLRRTDIDGSVCRGLARAAALTWQATEGRPPR